MKFPSKISHESDDRWVARHESPQLGEVEVTAATREQAVEKLRGELRYRLELCPCSGETYRDIEIELSES